MRIHAHGTSTRGRKLFGALLALTLFLMTALTESCGLLFTHGPPADHEQLKGFTCTDSRTGPAIDLVWGGLNLLGALAIANNPDQYTNSQQAIATGIGWAVVSFISGGIGMDKVSRCIGAKRELAVRSAEAESALVQTFAARNLQTVVVWPSADTIAVGAQVQLRAEGFASSGSPVPDPLFTWSSSNDAIASVSRAGLVTTHDAGKVIVAATANGITGTASLVVVAP
ncbi:MAG TPA: Ig-like domain-containing protein [Gemmatimonadales bacterium]|nr:Ig-like domain-containing protein [Gemmatimonadales bacterium]